MYAIWFSLLVDHLFEKMYWYVYQVVHVFFAKKSRPHMDRLISRLCFCLTHTGVGEGNEASFVQGTWRPCPT